MDYWKAGMKMKGLMKKILLLLAVVLSFGTVMADDVIRLNLSTVSGVEGVVTPFSYVRIVSSTTHESFVSGIEVGSGLSSNFRLNLTSEQVGLIQGVASSGTLFYFEFYNTGNNDDIISMGYSSYVEAADLAASISHIDNSSFGGWLGSILNQKAPLSLTGYAVPEPTSGLLLLVGGALLGLRRKRRVA